MSFVIRDPFPPLSLREETRLINYIQESSKALTGLAMTLDEAGGSVSSVEVIVTLRKGEGDGQ